MSRHRSSVGLRWPSERIAALQRLPIRSVSAARCALRCAPMAARSLRHLIGDATPVRRAAPLIRGGFFSTLRYGDFIHELDDQRSPPRSNPRLAQLRHHQAGPDHPAF
ncbi:hypothetical protein D8B34_10790 [Verminephrobacter eiseniae]|nr:hypothetical protein [Verminephrobacter eiseniae]MCW8184195.1 hypothetical protein [Verminephrobacter eiseniae]MCW8222732.1 hypothetical protein [Verminephrobacter eiseniae]MCW8234239.1 hypothetical protein [Verminephrobacter eiseniae]